jgi:copper chaperone CopZ
VEASHQEGTAVVTYQPETVTTEQIAEAIKSLGYEAELQTDEGEET